MADTKNDLNMELMKTEFKEEDEKKNKTNE